MKGSVEIIAGYSGQRRISVSIYLLPHVTDEDTEIPPSNAIPPNSRGGSEPPGNICPNSVLSSIRSLHLLEDTCGAPS